MTPFYEMMRYRSRHHHRIESWQDLVEFIVFAVIFIGMSFFYNKFFPEWGRKKCETAAMITMIVGMIIWFAAIK